MARSHHRRIYRETDHTADLRVEIFGRTEEELMVHSILTLYSLLGLPEETIGPGARLPGDRDLIISGMDGEDVLVRLLGELLTVAVVEKRRWLPRSGSCRLSRDGQGLLLQVEGRWRELLPQETDWKTEIKAVTYHDARIRHHPDGYAATVVMDL